MIQLTETEFEQSLQAAENRGYLKCADDMNRRNREIIVNFEHQVGVMKQFIEAVEKQASYFKDLINDSANDTKLINALLDFISCVACPLDNCNVISGSLQCREVLREYFEGRVKEYLILKNLKS